MTKVSVSLAAPSSHTIKFDIQMPVVRVVEDAVLLVEGHGNAPELAGALPLKNIQEIVVEEFRASE